MKPIQAALCIPFFCLIGLTPALASIPTPDNVSQTELKEIESFIKELLVFLKAKQVNQAKQHILKHPEIALKVMDNFAAQSLDKSKADRKNNFLYIAKLIRNTLPSEILLNTNLLSLRASTYLKLAMDKIRKNQCPEAIPILNELLELAKKKNMVKYIGGASNVLGSCYSELGQIKIALKHYQQAVNIWKAVKDQKTLITALNNLGQTYASANEFKLAQDTLTEALKLAEELNILSEKAQILHSSGLLHYSMGDNGRALEYYQQALDIRQTLGETLNIATTLNNIGHVYLRQDRYKQALEYVNQALKLRQKKKNTYVVQSLSSLATIYGLQGQYSKALEINLKVLKTYRKLHRKKDISTALNNLGLLYKTMGDYERALNYYQQALTLRREMGNKALIANSLNHLGGLYTNLKDYAQSLTYYQQALAINEQLNFKQGMSENLNGIGINQYLNKKYKKSLESYKKSLKIERELKNHLRIGSTHNNISLIYQKLNQPGKAIDYAQQAYKFSKLSNNKSAIINHLNNLGVIYANIKKYDEALQYINMAIAAIEKSRQQASGALKRTYLAKQMYAYKSLLHLQFIKKDYPKMLQNFEATHARYLSEQLSTEPVTIPDATQLQAQIPPQVTTLLYSNSDRSELFSLHMTPHKLQGQVKSTNKLLNEVELLSPQSFQFKPQTRALKKDNTRGITLLKEASFSETINKSLKQLITRYRTLLSNPNSNPQERKVLANLLYQHLVLPWEKNLQGKKELLIIPDGLLGFIPFETLINNQGRYLGELFDISYVQSMTTWNQLQKRKYSSNRKPMMAMGGAIYETIQYEQGLIESEQQLKQLKQHVWGNPHKKMTQVYGALMAPQWNPLPGSQAEVQKIKDFIPNSDILLGKSVNEENLKTMSAQGELARYKVLHFAVHGLTVDEIPELSALVLSQDNSNEDGYLRMDEIAKLNLKADFVNLSACETGLGRVQGGEGVVGLTQAFLVAGANGVLASLWKVDDEGTSTFMQSLYKQAKQGNYRQSVQTVKRQFMKGAFGEKYTHPYYWAPFVYYGK